MVEALRAIREYPQSYAGFQKIDRPLAEQINTTWVTWADHSRDDRLIHHLGHSDVKDEEIAQLFADPDIFHVFENIARRYIVSEVFVVTVAYRTLTQPDAAAVADLCLSFSRLQVDSWFRDATLILPPAKTLPTNRVLVLNAVKRALNGTSR